MQEEKMRLEDCKSKKPFTVPNGYFNELNRNIIEVTAKTSKETVAPKSKLKIGNILLRMSIAAMIVVIFAITLQGTYITSNNQRPGNIIAQSHYNTEDTEILIDGTTLDSDFIDKLFESYPIDDYTFYSYLTEYE